jgi:hypothetical protein
MHHHILEEWIRQFFFKCLTPVAILDIVCALHNHFTHRYHSVCMAAISDQCKFGRMGEIYRAKP